MRRSNNPHRINRHDDRGIIHLEVTEMEGWKKELRSLWLDGFISWNCVVQAVKYLEEGE